MNKILILSFVLAAVAFSVTFGKYAPTVPAKPAAPVVKPVAKPDVTIVKNTHTYLPNGGYKFSHMTSDGQEREETAGFNKAGIWEVKGRYSYIGSDNKKYIVTYVADDKGYRANTKSA